MMTKQKPHGSCFSSTRVWMVEVSFGLTGTTRDSKSKYTTTGALTQALKFWNIILFLSSDGISMAAGLNLRQICLVLLKVYLRADVKANTT